MGNSTEQNNLPKKLNRSQKKYIPLSHIPHSTKVKRIKRRVIIVIFDRMDVIKMATRKSVVYWFPRCHLGRVPYSA